MVVPAQRNVYARISIRPWPPLADPTRLVFEMYDIVIEDYPLRGSTAAPLPREALKANEESNAAKEKERSLRARPGKVRAQSPGVRARFFRKPGLLIARPGIAYPRLWRIERETVDGTSNVDANKTRRYYDR